MTDISQKQGGWTPGQPTGWEPGGVHVVAALKSLTRRERYHVERGGISDATPAMLRSLQNKAMFYLKIDSPNGRCGFMRLTPLGENVRALIKARANPSTDQGEG